MVLSRNILIIESKKDIRENLRIRLEDMEQNIRLASTAAEGLARIEWHGLPDLIFLSSKLDQLSGAHFLEALRERPFYVWTPCFQILAPRDEPLPGMAGFLELPVTAKKLGIILNSVDTPTNRIFGLRTPSSMPQLPTSLLQ